nr:serine protease easter-like [Aedes albopictus]
MITVPVQTGVTVRLGEWDINTPIDCEDQDYCADAPVDMDIERIIVHEDYKITGPYKYFNDIALIRFTRNVTFSPFISPICLPIESAQQNLNLTGTKGTATGWGLNDQETYGHVKQKVMLQIHDLQTCIDKYKSTRLTPKDTQLCAGGVPGQDTCRGDSGGPLTKLVRANHFLYGIVSMGSGCGSTIPGLYTNVVKYIDWIERNIH